MLESFFLVLFILLGFLILPGPDFYSIIRFAIHNGRKTSILCAVGISIGYLWNASFAYLVGEELYTEFKIIYTLIISIGCTYLLYMAVTIIIKVIKGKSTTIIYNKSNNTKNIHRKAVLTGFISNITNTKTILISLTIMPLIIKWPLHFVILLFVCRCLIGFGWYFIIAMVFNEKIRRILLKQMRWIDIIMAIIFILFVSDIVINYVAPAIK